MISIFLDKSLREKLSTNTNLVNSLEAAKDLPQNTTFNEIMLPIPLNSEFWKISSILKYWYRYFLSVVKNVVSTQLQIHLSRAVFLLLIILKRTK